VNRSLERGGGAMIKTRFKANVKQDGVFWFIQISDHENLFTQAQNIDEIEPMAREVISLMLDIPVDSFELELCFDANSQLS
jgi:predicted RNase H-like HicB family nuclease